MRMVAGTIMLLLLLAATVASADPVAFTSGPAVARDGEKVTVSFAVSAATDVAVAVVDAGGKVVRHLAAGAVGRQKAVAPLRPGLVQALVWDGKDDSGRSAGGGPFKVRVSLGLRAQFDRIIGWSGQAADQAVGLVCGPDGTLYMVQSGGPYAHRMTTLITAFDRDGKYLRQVMPGPGGLPPQKRPGWPHVRRDDGAEIPVVYHPLTRSPYPGAVFGNRVMPAVTGDGRIVVLSGATAGSTIKHPDVRGGRRVLILGADGSVPANFLGPVVAPLDHGGFGHVAVSPDNRFAYVAGLFETKGREARLCNVVWRVALDGSDPARVFVGTPFQAGSGQTGLNDPQGLAVDKDGNLYISDYGNRRVVAFKPDGSYLGEVAVDAPDTVRVSRRTGAIYVMCIADRGKPITDGHWYAPGHNWKVARVVRFNALGDKAPAASVEDLGQRGIGGGAYLALDDSGEQAVLWVSGLRYGGGPVVKVLDRGDALELAGFALDDLMDKGFNPLPLEGDLGVLNGRVIARSPSFRSPFSPESFVYDAATGASLAHFVPTTVEGKRENYWNLVYGECTSGQDGRVYVHAKDKLLRFDASGKPAPFAATGSHVLEDLPFDRHTHNSTLFVTRGGDIYLVAQQAGSQPSQALDDHDLFVQHIGPEGTVRNSSLVTVQGARLGGLAVDSAGNVYLGAQVAPPEQRIPPWFQGKLPPDGETPFPGNSYRQYGSVVRFPPTGGRIALDAKGPLLAHRQRESRVAITGGQVIARGGLVPGKVGPVGAGCNCEVSRFDIDSFDRLFVPDIFRFSVLVLDGHGNELTRFGGYGNMDSRGPGSPAPEPSIGLGWPLAVKIADDRAYVADLVNRRIVTVALDYAVSETCDVP